MGMFDSLKNFVANLGTERDKSSHTHYDLKILNDAELVSAFATSWLAAKIVNVPVIDATRKWRKWQADAKSISLIENEERRLGLLSKVKQAMLLARLFGGAAIYIGVDKTGTDKPLDVSKIRTKGIEYLTVLSKNDITSKSIGSDVSSEYFGIPDMYTISSGGVSVDVHPSRIIRFIGDSIPDSNYNDAAANGWGYSVLNTCIDAIKNADATCQNVASLVFESKVDVIKIKDFMENVGSKDYRDKLLQRIQLAMTTKGVNGALLLDSEEDYSSKQTTFSQLPEVIMTFLQVVAGAADIPMTRLVGRSPGGLNSTGENDIRNYYDKISGMQELEITPAMAIFDECLIRSALGNRPADVFYNWNSLWQTTSKERADIAKTTADTIKTLKETALIPDEVLSKVAVNMMTESEAAPGLESEYENHFGNEVGKDDENSEFQS